MLVDFLQQNIMWVAIAVMSGGMLIWPMITGAGARGVTPAEATLLMNREDAIVVDIRETSEWSTGHIAGARHIVLGQLETRLSEIEKFKSRPIIVCCASGGRSGGAVVKLKKAGFEKAVNLDGGLSAWSSANLPLTKKG